MPVPANVIFARAHGPSLLSAACLPVFPRSLSHRERTRMQCDVVSRARAEETGRAHSDVSVSLVNDMAAKTRSTATRHTRGASNTIFYKYQVDLTRLLSAACLPVFLRSLSHRECTRTKCDVVSRPGPERKRQSARTVTSASAALTTRRERGRRQRATRANEAIRSKKQARARARAEETGRAHEMLSKCHDI